MATRRQIKQKQETGALKSILLPLLIVFTMVSISCLGVWVRVLIVRTGYELHAARKEQKELLLRRRELTIETAALGSPERLAQIASSRLNLRFPRQGQVITLTDE